MANNLFNSIQLNKPKKNVFDLTHDVKLSANMGELTPILTLECVPGDKFDLSCESLIRFAPMIAPVMHRMDVTMHYFFVPNRILWQNWEKFITEHNSAHVLPYINYSSDVYFTAARKRFLDYMGVPPTPASGGTATQINALPLAAYQCIYNEYYRDQNLQAPIDYKLLDGEVYGNSPSQQAAMLTQRKRAWEHDYFTASLPFAQKGAAVDIPLGVLDSDVAVTWNSLENANTAVTYDGTNSTTIGSTPGLNTVGTPEMIAKTGDLGIEATTINDLRRAYKLQEWLEKNARGGTRYIENILTHFGVRSSDKRLQRPEYITGVKSPVVVSEVLNTTGEDGGLPQGNMAGHGISVTSGKSGSYYCEEHGYIIGIMSVMPKTAYQQGIPRTYLKSDSLDYFWPTFANIGEQEVAKQELYAYTANKTDTFGYVPRYAEYKYMPSRVAGEFRTSLNYWHLGRIFATEPSLNSDFVECDPTKRIFAVEDPATDVLYCHVLNKIRAIRPMPKYGTPAGL